jgi:hypothetical protein
MNKELAEYLGKNGDVLVTDDLLTFLRNKAYPNMVGAGKSTGIRLPSKSDIGTLAGVDINSSSFTKSPGKANCAKKDLLPVKFGFFCSIKSTSNLLNCSSYPNITQSTDI